MVRIDKDKLHTLVCVACVRSLSLPWINYVWQVNQPFIVPIRNKNVKWRHLVMTTITLLITREINNLNYVFIFQTNKKNSSSSYKNFFMLTTDNTSYKWSKSWYSSIISIYTTTWSKINNTSTCPGIIYTSHRWTTTITLTWISSTVTSTE